MKRVILVLAPSALVALVGVAGCASKEAPAELQDARAAYARAANGPAARSNQAGVMEAQRALEAAEHEYNEKPGSDKVKTLGYVAQRKVEIAEADGRTAVARSQQQQAEMGLLQLQAAQAKREAGVSERRAKVALEELGIEAKEEPRGTVVSLPGASFFMVNKADILPSAKKRLTDIANGVKKIMAERSPSDVGRKILLIGYTDNTGGDQHNMELSQRRAESVRVFFTQQGIDPSMLETAGRGEADPIADNSTAKGRADNRRVEIVISPPSKSMPPP